jgi:predicted Fe-Mo cluster-binding NifX family protein
MKLALSIFKDRISTVFDAADQLLVLEKCDDGQFKRSNARLHSTGGPARAAQLKEMGISVLICGAISRPHEAAITAAGMMVHPFVRGDVQEIIGAYENGQLHTAAYSLPGCQGRGRGAEHGRGRGRHCRRRSA